MSWWWLSFADPELPKGSQFLGAVLLESKDDPIAEAWRLGLNPGGEVRFFKVPPELEYRIDKEITYRLLNRAESESIDQKWKRLVN